MKKALKYLSFVAGSVIVLACLVAGFTQTGMFRSWLQHRLVTMLPLSAGTEMRIGNIEGNLFSNIVIRDIMFRRDGRKVLSIPRLAAVYDLSGIISRRVVVNSIQIDSLLARVRQDPDSTWDLQHMFSEPPQSETGPATLPDWSISVVDLFLNEWTVITSPLDTTTLLPKAFRTIQVHASVHLFNERVVLAITEFRCTVHSPDLQISSLDLRATYDGTKLDIEECSLQTQKNALHLRGTLWQGGDSALVTLTTAPIVFSELRHFLSGFSSSARPVIRAEVERNGMRFVFSADITSSPQHLGLRGTLDQSEGAARFSAKAIFKAVDPAAWIGGRPDRNSINGIVEVHGSGFDPDISTAVFSGSFGDSRLMGQRLLQAGFSGRYERGDARGKVDLETDIGMVRMTAAGFDLTGSQTFRAHVDASGLDLQRLAGINSRTSDVSLTLDVEGSGFNPEKTNTRARLFTSPFRIAGVPVDTVLATVGLHNGRVSIDTVLALSPVLQLSGSGIVHPAGDARLRLYGTFGILDSLAGLVGLETMAAHGSCEAQLAGTVDAPEGTLIFSVHDVWLDSLSVGRAAGRIQFTGVSNTITSLINAEMHSARYGTLFIDSIEARGSYRPGYATCDLSFSSGDSVLGAVQSRIVIDSSLTVALPFISVGFSGQEWRTVSDSGWVSIGPEEIQVQNLSLSDGTGSVQIDGAMGTTTREGLSFHLRDFDLRTLAPFLQTRSRIRGKVTLDLRAEGAMARPTAMASFLLDDLAYGETAFGSIDGKLGYRDSVASWEVGAVFPSGNTLSSKGRLPINPSAGDSIPLIDRTRPYEIRLKSDDFDLSRLRNVSGAIDELRGRLDLNVEATGFRDSVALRGGVRLTEGAVRSKKLGFDYPRISAEVTAVNNRFQLKEFSVVQPTGSLKADGMLGSVENLLQGELHPLRLRIATRNFQVVSSDDIELVCDGSIDARDSAGFQVVSGTLEVTRSRLSLPALQQRSGIEISGPPPMLVAALTRADTSVVATIEPDRTEGPSALKESLRGRVKVKIPRNLWVSGNRFQAEISGDLDLIFTGGEPLIAGYMDILRGYFEIVSVRLQFKESRVWFTGADNLNPTLDIHLEHQFRDSERRKRTVAISITGEARKLERRYALDNKTITEEDAMSYLLFGQAATNLTAGQKDEASGKATQLVDNITSSIVSARLSATLGKSLGLDVLQVRGEQNWSKTSFTAGKYVTNELYVSYERGFGNYESNDIAPEVFSLEYQILEFLSLQLTGGNDKRSGLDVVFNIR